MIMDNPVLFAWLLVATLVTLERGLAAIILAASGQPVGIYTFVPKIEPLVGTLWLTLCSVIYADNHPPDDPRFYFCAWITTGFAGFMIVVGIVEARHQRTVNRLRNTNRLLWRRIITGEGWRHESEDER